MKRQVSYGAVAVVGLSLLGGSGRFVQAHGDDDSSATPIVFQAAGPTVASIQSMVDAFRGALGGNNNLNLTGPLPDGRREINWDGGGSTATAVVPTPFDGFLLNRGGRFTTPGSGFVQAPVDGLATTFNNPTYTTIFQAFSPTRLFSPIDRNVTNARFFVPGGGELPATTVGFGAIFSDVDQIDGRDDKYGHNYGYDRRDKGRDEATTTMSFYGKRGNLLYKADVPASTGDASLSFVGVLFDSARIAYVRIKTGTEAPGPKDKPARDIVMMDDFIYGEPQAIAAAQAGQEIESLESK